MRCSKQKNTTKLAKRKSKKGFKGEHGKSFKTRSDWIPTLLYSLVKQTNYAIKIILKPLPLTK